LSYSTVNTLIRDVIELVKIIRKEQLALREKSDLLDSVNQAAGLGLDSIKIEALKKEVAEQKAKIKELEEREKRNTEILKRECGGDDAYKRQMQRYYHELKIKDILGGLWPADITANKAREKWIVQARHAFYCQAPEGKCPLSAYCTSTKMLWSHLNTCRNPTTCTTPNCVQLRDAVNHYQNCNPKCATCFIVRTSVDPTGFCEVPRVGMVNAPTPTPTHQARPETSEQKIRRLKSEIAAERLAMKRKAEEARQQEIVQLQKTLDDLRAKRQKREGA
jgi:hypothetical protein